MISEYSIECTTIEDNCKYTAEAHHVIALASKRMQRLLQLIPAIASALFGTLVAGQIVPQWVAWVAALSAILTAITTVVDPVRSYYEHVTAAKAFTIIKHDARALRDTFGPHMTEHELMLSVRLLHDRYNALVLTAPPTNEKAMKKAQDRIKTGVHSPDQQIQNTKPAR